MNRVVIISSLIVVAIVILSFSIRHKDDALNKNKIGIIKNAMPGNIRIIEYNDNKLLKKGFISSQNDISVFVDIVRSRSSESLPWAQRGGEYYNLDIIFHLLDGAKIKYDFALDSKLRLIYYTEQYNDLISSITFNDKDYGYINKILKIIQ